VVSAISSTIRIKPVSTHASTPTPHTIVPFWLPWLFCPPRPFFCTFSTTALAFKDTLPTGRPASSGAGSSHFRSELSELPVTMYVSIHCRSPSTSATLGGPHASDTVRVRDGKDSQRSRCVGGGSSAPWGGIERKERVGAVVDRQRRVCVGETESDQMGAEGMGVMFCDELWPDGRCFASRATHNDAASGETPFRQLCRI
jgi:hypothetical protein